MGLFWNKMTRKVCLLVLLLIGIFKPGIAFTAGVEIDFNQAQCSKKGDICGDKCVGLSGFCQCGEERFDTYDKYYCCIPQNVNCRRIGEKWLYSNVTCPEGIKLPQDTFCDNQRQCPISKSNGLALFSNCSHIKTKYCPKAYGQSSIICSDLPGFRQDMFLKNMKPCPKANGGLEYKQAISFSEDLPLYGMPCLSRRLPNDSTYEIFDPLKQKKRTNLYKMINVKNGRIICDNKIYSIHDLCGPYINLKTNEKGKCIIDGIVKELEQDHGKLGPNSWNVCLDYSFWQSSTNRCTPIQGLEYDGDVYKTYQSLCNKESFLCTSTHSKHGCPNSTFSVEICNKEKDFYCEESNTCIPIDYICDGTVNCLHGEDEGYELCKDKLWFHEEATIECLENRLNYDIKIKAVPCDGNQECRDGSDENCEENNWFFVGIVAAYVIVTNSVYHYLKWRCLEKKSECSLDDNSKESLNPTDCAKYVGDRLAQLKNETTQAECAKLLETPGIFSKMKVYLNRIFFGKRTSNISEPITIVSTQVDPIKDFLLVMRMIIILGGPLAVVTNPQIFSSCVVYLLTMTIIGPQFLGTLRSVLPNCSLKRNWKHTIICVIRIIFFPFYLYVEQIKMAYLRLQLKASPSDQSLAIAIEDLKRTLNMHVKLELGLETIYQLSGQLILLLLAYTKTPTQNGLKTMFNEGLDLKAQFYLVTSILLSFYSCIHSHWKALTVCREHFPTKSRVVSSLYCLCGCLSRVTAIIMCFAGPLGLFSVLIHLQQEQIPWSVFVLDLVSPDGFLVLGDNEPFQLSLIDRWQKNGSLFREYENGELIRDIYGKLSANVEHFISPPDYTLYTGVRLRYYLFMFLANVGTHMLVIFVLKSLFNKAIWNGLTLLEKLIHCLENTNIAYNIKEWDDGKGNACDHKKRMQQNWIEVLVVIITKFNFNISLLSSYIFLVFKMQERHDILNKTVGYLDEEQEALDFGYWLLKVALCIMIVCFLLEILFFWLYNGHCHPFANILKDSNNDVQCTFFVDLKTTMIKLKKVIRGCTYLNEVHKSISFYTTIGEHFSAHFKQIVLPFQRSRNLRDVCMNSDDYPKNQSHFMKRNQMQRTLIILCILIGIILIVTLIFVICNTEIFDKEEKTITPSPNNHSFKMNLICSSDEFQCKNNEKCVPISFQCDGIHSEFDCSDGSDEENCFLCRDQSKNLWFRHVFPLSEACDVKKDCIDGSDEENCEESECEGFLCKDKRCISKHDRCNGVKNCLDGSDEDEENCNENYCKHQKDLWCTNPNRCALQSFGCKTCADYDFNCFTCKTDSKSFIKDRYFCNGIEDCSDGSDEQECDKYNTCQGFLCDNGECIPSWLRCSGEARDRCRDASDKGDCFNCKSGQGQTQKSFVCDGEFDCKDGSDEYECDALTCKGFWCASNKCIRKSHLCDGTKDCSDGSDEENCENVDISSCYTVSGKDVNKTCVLPFRYGGVKYATCTSNGLSDGTYWCPTSVNEAGNYIKGKWGRCSSNCPMPMGHRMNKMT